MENRSGVSSCFSGSNTPQNPHQSPWLQTTQSGMDRKMKAIMTLVEENGLSLAQRGKKYCNRKQEINAMLEEFNRSYHSLAEKYDHLRSNCHDVLSSESSSSSDDNKIQFSIKDNDKRSISAEPKLEDFSKDFKSVAQDHDGECKLCNIADFDLKNLNKLANKLVSSKNCNKNFEIISQTGDDQIYGGNDGYSDKDDTTPKRNYLEWRQLKDVNLSVVGSHWENTWNELIFQFTTITEENLQLQAELAKRNDEKRQVIKELELQLNRLRTENKALKICCRFSKVDPNPNCCHMRRIVETVLSKVFGRDSP